MGHDFPIIGNMDFGYYTPNLPLPLGIKTAMNTDGLEVWLKESNGQIARIARANLVRLDLHLTDESIIHEKTFQKHVDTFLVVCQNVRCVTNGSDSAQV